MRLFVILCLILCGASARAQEESLSSFLGKNSDYFNVKLSQAGAVCRQIREEIELSRGEFALVMMGKLTIDMGPDANYRFPWPSIQCSVLGWQINAVFDPENGNKVHLIDVDYNDDQKILASFFEDYQAAGKSGDYLTAEYDKTILRFTRNSEPISGYSKCKRYGWSFLSDWLTTTGTSDAKCIVLLDSEDEIFTIKNFFYEKDQNKWFRGGAAIGFKSVMVEYDKKVGAEISQRDHETQRKDDERKKQLNDLRDLLSID